MGLFDGLGLSEVSSDPWSVMDGTYQFNVVDCTAGPTKDGLKNGILFKFEVISEGSEQGKTQTEWLEIPKKDDVSGDAMRCRSFLRARMESLGIPETKFNSVDAADFISITGYMTIATGKKKGGKYIAKITLDAPPEGVTTASAPAASNANLFG
jgi:hypothetical protein